MRVRLLNLLLLAALALAVTRLWQFRKEPPPTLPPIVEETTSPDGDPGTGGPPPAPVEARPEDFDVIVARDLFSPTRGVVPPAPTSGAKTPPPPPPQQPPPKLTLYGVVILDGDKYAFLQEGTQDARPRKVREQEAFAGGTLSAIRPDGVTFIFGGSEMTVPLRTPKESGAGRGAAAGAAARAAAGQPAGAVGVPGAPVRRRGQPAIVPGRMPGEMPAPGGPPGMPVFPVPAEPADDGSGDFEIAPDEVFDPVDEEMPLGEEIIQ